MRLGSVCVCLCVEKKKKKEAPPKKPENTCLHTCYSSLLPLLLVSSQPLIEFLLLTKVLLFTKVTNFYVTDNNRVWGKLRKTCPPYPSIAVDKQSLQCNFLQSQVSLLHGFLNLFIYLFIYGCVGSSFLCKGFL